MYKFCAASLLVGSLAPTMGVAATSAAVRAACLNDAKKFCSSVIQDDEARRNCMKAHASELSPAASRRSLPSGALPEKVI